MNTLIRFRSIIVFSAVLLALILASGVLFTQLEPAGKAKVFRKGPVQEYVVNASPDRPAIAPAVPPSGFTPQTRLGFDAGDQWEPAIASDRFGHVYVLYAQYTGVPGCPDCSNPTQILQVSNDHGQTWGSPVVIYPASATTGGQWDSQIVVDPMDGRTVYASFMQNNKSDIIVAKSTDFGVTWSFVTADSTNAGTDKPILAVRGQDVYVVYTHAQTTFAASSHDGGATFTESTVSKGGKLGWALAGGGTVTPNGNVFFAWAGYERNGGATGNVNLYVSKSTDGGVTWSNTVIDISSAPPDCSAFSCGWAYLGAQMVLTSDEAGTLYGLWNAGSAPKGPERIYFARSTDNGNTWTTKADISTAPPGSHHAFPAIAAVGNGAVRISWMDARAANGRQDRWNVYYRSSTTGGATWSPEVDLSTYVAGYAHIFPDGFRFPFGDYYEMDIDEQGTSHLVFGEGYSYDSPGSIWYVKGK
jgi:hypothetical protein